MCRVAHPSSGRSGTYSPNGTSRVFEYAPREVKLAVVGQGGAEKGQVQLMVRTLLQLEGELTADAADAIGLALCHAYSRATRSYVAAAEREGRAR